jgi:hypothetical protein
MGSSPQGRRVLAGGPRPEAKGQLRADGGATTYGVELNEQKKKGKQTQFKNMLKTKNKTSMQS